MTRSVIESILLHSVLIALLFIGASVAGSGNLEKPTLITMSTSIIDTPPPGPVDEPVGIPEPVQPEPPKPKPKKEVQKEKKPEIKPEPVEATPIPVEKTVEEVSEAQEDNATFEEPAPVVAAATLPINPEGKGGGQNGPNDSVFTHLET
jgi:outer membrane biosynthesis protein TonB